MKILLANHNRALELKEEKIEVSGEQIEPSLPNAIPVPSSTTYEDKINQVEKLYPDKVSEFEKVKTKPVSKFDNVGLLDLLLQRFSRDDLKVLVFRFTNNELDFDDDIAGSTKNVKAMHLIQYFDRRQQLGDFYEFVKKEIG